MIDTCLIYCPITVGCVKSGKQMNDIVKQAAPPIA